MHCSRSLLWTSLSFTSALSSVPLCLLGCDPEPEHSERVVVRYAQYCASCHDTGAANAPRRGDAQAWEVRMRKGRQQVVQSMIDGLVAMPPKGGCADCSRGDLEALQDYLLQTSP